MPAEVTPRQIECLQLAGIGMSDAAIAHYLKISRKTVSNQLFRAYEAMGVRDRYRAAELVGIRYPGVGIPSDELDRLATDRRRPGGASVVSAEGDRPWLARVWKPLPRSRVVILTMIFGVAIAFLMLFAGAASLTAGLADTLERLTGRS